MREIKQQVDDVMGTRTCLLGHLASSLQDKIASSREIPRHTSIPYLSLALRNEARRQHDIWERACILTTQRFGSSRAEKGREEQQLLIYWRLLRHREPDQRRRAGLKATLEDQRACKRRHDASFSSPQGFPFSVVGRQHFRSFEDEIKTTVIREARSSGIIGW